MLRLKALVVVVSTLLLSLSPLQARGAEDDDVYVEWVDASGNAHLSPIDPQSFTRLLKRPNPSIRLLKRSGDHAAADEDLDKRAAMVRLLRSGNPEEHSEDKRASMVRLLRSGPNSKVRLMKKSRGDRYMSLRTL